MVRKLVEQVLNRPGSFLHLLVGSVCHAWHLRSQWKYSPPDEHFLHRFKRALPSEQKQPKIAEAWPKAASRSYQAHTKKNVLSTGPSENCDAWNADDNHASALAEHHAAF